MILIISDVGGSVNDVIDWITSKGVVVHRLNPLYNKNITINEVKLNKHSTDIEINYPDNTTFKFSDYTSIWIWHSNLKFSNSNVLPLENHSIDLLGKVKYNLDQHHKVLINYLGFYLSLNKKKIIGNYNTQSLNKLEVLLRCKNLGIDIPESFIVTKKQRLLELSESKSFITKPYYETTYLTYKGRVYQNYTSTVDNVKISELNEDIFPTLIQEKIEKKFELRTFFINDQFFSMAIFSQESTKTEVDFRNYNFENPNRTVPYKLPVKIEKKLIKLFKELNLNSGSIDMIYSKDDRYVFLEINPVGQIGMVSFPCNYYLEEILMKILTNERY